MSLRTLALTVIPADCVTATQRIFHCGAQATSIELPVVEAH